MSHPTWVRGLKLRAVQHLDGQHQSHPTWVRGLKFRILCVSINYNRRTPRGCVD